MFWRKLSVNNRYLRLLFVQPAWVVPIKLKSLDRHGLKPWLEAAKNRLHHNLVANKFARIAWSVSSGEQDSGRVISESSKHLTCQGLRED
jgi:hypothetical protein